MHKNLNIKIYAMVGAMGSGKTTLALKISREKGAHFYSLDKTIKNFNVPIKSLTDYENNMKKALDILSLEAIETLKSGKSVVFDFGGGIGHWNWLKNIADTTDVDIEIYYFEIPLEVRLERVRKRNSEKPKDIYHFIMSDEEVMASKTSREIPLPSDRVKIIKLNDY